MDSTQQYIEAAEIIMPRKGNLSPAEDKLLTKLMMRKDDAEQYNKEARRPIELKGVEGQWISKRRVYFRCPPARGDEYYSRSVREVGYLLMMAAKLVCVDCMDAIRWVSNNSTDCQNHVVLFVEQRTKEERTNMTIKLYEDVGAGGWRGVERIRLFYQNYILGLTQKQLGTKALPLHIKGAREYQDSKVPRETYFHGSEFLEIGKKGSSGKTGGKGKDLKKIKDCEYCISMHPDELLAQGFQHIIQKNRYVDMNEISHGRNHFCLGVTNCDKGGEETSWFFRFASQEDSNQPKYCLMLAKYGNGATEGSYNIQKVMVEIPSDLKDYMLGKYAEQGFGPPVAAAEVEENAHDLVVESDLVSHGSLASICYRYTKSDLEKAGEGAIFAAEDTESLDPPITWRRICLRKESGDMWSILGADTLQVLDSIRDTQDHGPIAEFGTYYRSIDEMPSEPASFASESEDINDNDKNPSSSSEDEWSEEATDAPTNAGPTDSPTQPSAKSPSAGPKSSQENSNNKPLSAAVDRQQSGLKKGDTVRLLDEGEIGNVIEERGSGWFRVKLHDGNEITRRSTMLEKIADRSAAEDSSIEVTEEQTSDILNSFRDIMGGNLDLGEGDDILQNPLQEIMQNLLDDNCVTISVAFKEIAGGKLLYGTAMAILPSPHPQETPLCERGDENLPDSLEEMIVTEEKYLSPCIKRVYAKDSSDLRLLRYKGVGLDQFVGVGVVDESGKIAAWSRFQTDGKVLSALDYEPVPICSHPGHAQPEEETVLSGCDNCNDAECNVRLEGLNLFLPEGVQPDAMPASQRAVPCSCKRIFVIEGSDGKMACLLIHHQGQRGKFCCPGCIAELKSMADLDVEAPLRDNEFADSRMYERFADFRHPSSKVIQNQQQTLHSARRDASKNIDGKPPLRIHDYKKCETMHMLMRNMEHIDDLVITDLYKISSTSLCRDKYQELVRALEESLEHGQRLLQKCAETYERMKAKRNASQEELSEAHEACIYAYNFVTAHQQSIYDTKKFVGADKKKCLLTMIFTEAYFEVSSTTMGKYFSGRTLTYCDATTVLANWVMICKYFIATVEQRANGLFNIDDLQQVLRKATELVLPLLKVETIQQKQGKVTSEDAEKLKEYYIELKEALQRNYPGVKPWWYAHYGIRHMAEKAFANGTIGRLMAQGPEAFHALENTWKRKLWSCKDPKKRNRIIVKNLLTLNSNDTGVIKEECARRSRKMPKRPRKRTLATIHDDNATDPFHALIEDYGCETYVQDDYDSEDDSICAELRNRRENDDLDGTAEANDSSATSSQNGAAKEEEAAEQEEEKCSLLFGKYVPRSKPCEDALGDDRQLVQCRKCSMHVPEKAIAVHEVIVHETSDNVEKAVRSIKFLKGSNSPSAEEDADNFYWDESSAQEESSSDEDDGAYEENSIHTESGYTLDDALTYWNQSKRTYVWQESSAEGPKVGDNFVLYKEWGWEMFKVHDLKNGNKEQKDMAENMTVPVYCRISSDRVYVIRDVGREDLSYLSKESFQKLLDGEDEKNLGIEADKSWCIVRLGE